MFEKKTFVFRIPNTEVSQDWQKWMVTHFKERKNFPSLLKVSTAIIDGDAEGFQRQFTAFLQEYLSLFCVPHHREKVYEALCFMLIFALFGEDYNVRMEQDGGHGRSDITAHPFARRSSPALLFEIKSVSGHFRRNGRRSVKTIQCMQRDMQKAKAEGLAQLERLRYRERVPLHATKVHEYAFVFCGKFCVAAVRTLERNASQEWVEVTTGSTSITSSMTEIVDISDDEDEDV